MKSLDVTIRIPPELRLSAPDHLVAEDAVEREELLAWHVHEDAGVVYFLSLVVGDAAAAREVAEHVDSIRSVELSPVDDDTFYAYVEMEFRDADRVLMAPFDDQRVVLVPPVVYQDDRTVQLTVLGDPADFADVVADFPDDVSVTVERLGEHRHLAGSLAGRLTRRQFEALETARRLGYYEVPRESSLAAVAAELACSESAASTLLRKAERALVDAALGR